jgi:hypothetical protein
MPKQNAKIFGEKDLSKLLDKNIDIGNAMDTSDMDTTVNGGKSGKKKSKSKTVKRKTKKQNNMNKCTSIL